MIERWPRSTPRRRSRGRRRCRRTRCAGSPATSPPSGGGGAGFRPAPRLQPGPHPPDRPRPAAAAARRLRRARADLQHAAAAHPGRLHARPRGEPLRHRRPAGELPLARVELRRPDPAARRRPADGRRRLPRPRPGDDAARLPPRASRRRDGGDVRRGRAGDRHAAPRRASSTSTTGCGTWRCGSRCGRCSASIPTRPARAPPPPSTSSGPSATTASTTALRLLRGPGSPWRRLIASRKVLDEIVFAEIARRRAEPDPEPPTSSASWSAFVARGARRFSDREVRDQVMTLMFAGHDTSTSTLDLHDARAGPPPRRPRAPGRGAGPGARRRRRRPSSSSSASCPIWTWCSTRSCASTRRPGSARAAPCATSSSAATRFPRRLRQLLLLGQPPDPRGLPRPRGLHPRALHPRAQGGAAARRLRPLRRRQRVCIGKRFGQTEVKLVATMLLQRLRLDALPAGR